MTGLLSLVDTLATISTTIAAGVPGRAENRRFLKGRPSAFAAGTLGIENRFLELGALRELLAKQGQLHAPDE